MRAKYRAVRAAILSLLSAGVVAALLLRACSASPAQAGQSASPAASPSALPSPTLSPTPSPRPTPTPTPAATFSPTGGLAQARMNHTATLLADGRVLIAGGSRMKGSAVDYLSSAELFDPKTGKFAKTGSLAAARAGHTATLLADGRVLIAGGYGWRVSPCTGMCSNTEELVSAELYDPKTGKFSKARPMSFPLAGHDATRLQDGRVLLIGGFYELVGELYDLTTGRFTALALPGMFGTGHAAVLADGRVFVVAGLGSCVAGLLSPDSGVLAPITRRPGACPDSAITVADGRVALFESGFVETYDRRDGTYVDVGELPGDYTYWNGARATLLADGRILYCGGVGLGGKALALTGIYDPVRGLFSPGPMVAARSGHTATLLLDGSVLIVGGSSGRVLASAELFQLEPAAP